jgi:glycosyltransferase involved in cell wall biosynthesis
VGNQDRERLAPASSNPVPSQFIGIRPDAERPSPDTYTPIIMVHSPGPTGILHVIAPVPAGGAETVVLGLALAGAAHGLQPTVAALLQDSAPSPLVERLKQDGIPVHEIRCGRRRYLKEAGMVEEVAAQCGAELIHTHVYHGDAVGYLAARRRRVPVIATVHGFTGGDWKNRLYQWTDQLLLRRFDAIICVSNPVRDQLRHGGIRPERLHLIPNAYQATELYSMADARARLGLNATGPVVGWVGRLSAEKGPDLFLTAMASDQLANATGIMLGDGAERAALLQQRELLGLAESRLRMPGGRGDAAAAMPAFDVMVLSSRTEGTPMALLEAMSAGVPVVAFAVGGVPQVLDQNSGWLVPAEDTAALAAAIRSVLADPEESRRRAMVAREVVKNRYGVAQWIEQIREVYSAVAAR